MQRHASLVCNPLATAAPTRIAYVLPTAVRSHGGAQRAADRHLVRPGRGPDPHVGAAGDPAAALRQPLSPERRGILARAAVRLPPRRGTGVVSAALYGLAVSPGVVAHAARAARQRQ